MWLPEPFDSAIVLGIDLVRSRLQVNNNGKSEGATTKTTSCLPKVVEQCFDVLDCFRTDEERSRSAKKDGLIALEFHRNFGIRTVMLCHRLERKMQEKSVKG